MAKQIIVDKLNEYSDFKKELRHSKNVANDLGFNVQSDCIQKDIAWCTEILELLISIRDEK